jgi:hypothetical protein
MNNAVGEIVSEGSAYIERAPPPFVFNVIKAKLSEITLKGKLMNLTEEQIITIWNESFKVKRPRESVDEDEDVEHTSIDEEEDNDEGEIEEGEGADPISPSPNRRRRATRGEGQECMCIFIDLNGI